MKVLHVMHWPKSGIVNLVSSIIKNIESDELDFSAIFFEHDDETESVYLKLTSSLSFLNISAHPLKSVGILRRQLKAIQPDIVHVHSFLPHLFLWFLKSKRTILVRTIHSDYPYFYSRTLKARLKRIIEKFTVSKTDVTVCVSHSIKETSPVLVNSNVCVIENGTDLSTKVIANKSQVREELGIPDEATCFVSVGRAEHQKGFDLLLKAFHILLANTSNIYLLIVGDGSQLPKLNEMVRQLGIEKQVRLLGYKSDPFKYLVASNVYISSSRYEGLPLAMIEAMSIGLPVIGFSVSGVKDVIQHLENGVLVNKIDELELSECITKCLENPELLHNIAKRGQVTVRESYDIKTTACRYIDLYQELISRR